MAIVTAPRPKLSFWDKLYLPAVIRGLRITAGHFFKKKVTVQFPEVRPVFPPRYRGYPELIMGQDEIPKCVACKLCEVVCPPGAITIEIGEYPNQEQRERIPAQFTIDMGRCIVCGMCEEACPCDAIRMSDTHIMSSSTRTALVFRKDLLLEDYHKIETMR